MKKTSSFQSLFLWPIVLAILTTSGLIFALVGDGLWDVLSWLALFVPIAVMVGLFRKRR